MVPHGFRFNPTDEELIEILHRKATGQEVPLHFIIQFNIYTHEPQHLPWEESGGISTKGKEERYYYCKKENDSREVAGKGWWKATSHVKQIFVNPNLVGHKRPLTFHRYKDSDRNRNNAIKTNWIMHEFSLHSFTTEWRLCKIKYKGKPSMQEELESIRQRFSSSNDFEAGSSTPRDQQLQQHHYPLAAVNSAMPADNNNNDDNNWNMEQQLPQPSYDLPTTIDHSSDYYFSDQNLESYDEEQFSSLWSWQN